ncbi:hypothetical protein [Crateriforma conspicua]|nr:hypothetical protein [Crateriforma conspicua]
MPESFPTVSLLSRRTLFILFGILLKHFVAPPFFSVKTVFGQGQLGNKQVNSWGQRHVLSKRCLNWRGALSATATRLNTMSLNERIKLVSQMGHLSRFCVSAFWTRCCVVLLCIPFSASSLANQVNTDSSEGDVVKGPSKRVVQIERACVLTRVERRLPRVEVDFGSHLPGTVIDCLLTVKNHTNSDLVFSSIQPGCQCLSLSPRSGVLPDKSNQVFRIRISTPTNPSKVRSEVGILARRANGSPLFSIRPFFSASGVVAFVPSYVDTEIPVDQDNHEIQIPFLLGADTKQELIDLTASQSLANIETALDFENSVVRMRVKRKAIKNGPIAGSLKLTNIETGSSSDVMIDISTSHPLTVAPRTLVMHLDAEQGRYTGKIVASDRRPDGDGSKLKCDFYATSKPLASERVRQVGQVGIYRIFFDAPDPASEPPENLVIECRLMAGKLLRTVKIPVVFSSRSPNQE